MARQAGRAHEQRILRGGDVVRERFDARRVPQVEAEHLEAIAPDGLGVGRSIEDLEDFLEGVTGEVAA